jgi:hypothetical protein
VKEGSSGPALTAACTARHSLANGEPEVSILLRVMYKALSSVRRASHRGQTTVHDTNGSCLFRELSLTELMSAGTCSFRSTSCNCRSDIDAWRSLDTCMQVGAEPETRKAHSSCNVSLPFCLPETDAVQCLVAHADLRPAVYYAYTTLRWFPRQNGRQIENAYCIYTMPRVDSRRS